MLVTKMTWQGGQSRQYFIDLMAWLGFRVIIKEWAPVHGRHQPVRRHPLVAGQYGDDNFAGTSARPRAASSGRPRSATMG